MTYRSSQAGSVFVYILIGIVLFAALGYAVSRSSMRTEGVSDDKVKLLATEIINYSNQIQSAVVKLRLRGCKDNQFDFSNSIYLNVDGTTTFGMAPNSNTPSDGSCKLFASTGGNITATILPSAAFASTVVSGRARSGHGEVAVAQIQNAGSSANDLWMQFLWVNRATCLAVNTLLGNANPGGEPPEISFTGGETAYTNGDLTSTAVLSNSFNGAFCYHAVSNYGLLITLLPR